jgi:hypothetical protein
MGQQLMGAGAQGFVDYGASRNGGNSGGQPAAGGGQSALFDLLKKKAAV